MTDISVSRTTPAPALRILQVVTPAGTTRAPLVWVFGYVVATFALFLIWPVQWPIYYASGWIRLIGYVTLCFLTIGGTTLIGSAGATRVVAPLRFLSAILAVGAIVSVLILVPTSYAYTGRPPWEAMDALRNQAAAYRRLQSLLIANSGQRNTIVAMRAIVSPLLYAVLPLGVMRWSSINWLGRLAVIVTVLSSVVFSIMRGTDKEMADLLVAGVSAGLVAYGRSRAVGHRGWGILGKYWKHLLIGSLFLYFAQGLFTERKAERLGGYVSRTAVCANDSHICANLNNPWISWLPQPQRFGLTFFILSTCSGYYGLELALEKPFESSLGIGHSPASLSIYEGITGDPSIHMRTFTYRNAGDHWSEDYYWSTLMTWIANDVGFPGSILVLALIGYCWGRWWREATAGFSDPAAILFTLGTMMMVYLPANNQVFASYDGYVVFACWLSIWIVHRHRAGLLARIKA